MKMIQNFYSERFYKRTFALLTFIFICSRSFAGIETFNARVASPAITSSSVLSVQDDKFYTMQSVSSWPSDFYNKKITNRVIFSIDQENKEIQPTAYTATVNLQITYYTWNTTTSAFQSNSTTKALTINYDPAVNHNDKSVYEFVGGNSMIVQVLSISSGSVALSDMNLSLQSEIEVERYYTFDPEFTPSVISHNSNNLVAKGELDIWWAAIPGAEEYDLEWFFINDYSGSSTLIDERVFQFNSTRITTSNTTYTLPYIYGKGYILYRVRGVGKTSLDNYTEFIQGRWSSQSFSFTSTTVAADYPNRFPIKSGCPYFDAAFNTAETQIAHQDNLNWQFSVNYAEEGRSSASISYFDGSLHNRQTVAKSKTLDKIIVGETIYDHQGRPAIQVLPVPVDNPKIDFNPNFNRNGSSLPYGKADFDLNGGMCPLIEPEPMQSTTSGASNYYSSDNGLQNGQQAYVPDAQKFPFVQTEYTPDNTGRVRSQSGAGQEFRLGSGHESKFYYGKPEQEEIDRLFGSEAGNAKHYKKNLVRDANGQLSVSYMDALGRTIATSLTGMVPANLMDLDGINWTDMNIDLLNKVLPTDNSGLENELNLPARSLSVNKEVLVGADAIREFKYKMLGTKYDETCGFDINWPEPDAHTESVSDHICYDCVLELNLSLTDECNVEYLPGVGTTSAGAPSSPYIIGQSILDQIDNDPTVPFDPNNCSSTPPSYEIGFTAPWETNVAGTPTPLKPGNYSLNKTLTVNQKALDFYTKDYMENNECLLDLDYFLASELANVDFTGCGMTCEQCLESLGSYDLYNEAITPNCDPCYTLAQYQVLVDQCNENCDDASMKCDAGYQTMFADVSLQGQYGQVMPGGSVSAGIVVSPLVSAIDPSNYPVSVFNENNSLPQKDDYYVAYTTTSEPKNSGWGPNWRYPYNPDQISSKRFTYLDENGEIARIPVTALSGGGYSPAVETGVSPETISGQLMIRPQFLANVIDFIDLWQSEWATALVHYHPEYGYYTFCTSISTSHDFDDKWMEIDEIGDATTAFGTDFMDPATSNIDPYFNSTTTNPHYTSIEETAFVNAMNNFASGMSIWEVAYKTANCPNEGTGMGCSACTYNPSVGLTTDAEWNIYKGLYLSLKQKFQQQVATKYAITEGFYNGCIGKDVFNPFLNNFYNSILTSSPWTGTSWSFFHSQFYNFEQPCNWARYHLYKDKQPRFPGVSDLMDIDGLNSDICYDPAGTFDVVDCPDESAALIEETDNLTALSLYQQCGQCPNAHNLQMMVSALITKGDFYNTAVPLSCYSASSIYPEFTENFATQLPFTSLTNVTWDYNSGSSVPGTLYVADFTSGAQSCDLKLKFTSLATGTTTSTTAAALLTAGVYDFSDILSVCCLKYIASPTYFSASTNRNFQLTATVMLKSGDPDYDSYAPRYRELILEGVTGCMDIGGCTFDPICRATGTAKELQGLFNGLLFESTTPSVTESFTSSSAVSISAFPFNAVSNPLKYKLDAAIDPAVTDPAAVWDWTKLSIVSGTLTARINTSSTPTQTGNCDFTFTLPTTNPYGFTFADLKSFSNIKPYVGGSAGDFKITALMDNGTNSGYLELTGNSTCFAIGDCSTSLPEAFALGEIGYDNVTVDNWDFEITSNSSISPSTLLFDSDHGYQYAWPGFGDKYRVWDGLETDATWNTFNLPDHTLGYDENGTPTGNSLGQMLVVDGVGEITSGTPASPAETRGSWKQDFTLEAGKKYSFSFWATRLYANSEASGNTVIPMIDAGLGTTLTSTTTSLQSFFLDNGKIDGANVNYGLTSTNTSSTSGTPYVATGGVELHATPQWQHLTTYFVAPPCTGAGCTATIPTTDVTLVITGYGFNEWTDYAIDDIVLLKESPEPASPMCDLTAIPMPSVTPDPNPCMTELTNLAGYNAETHYQAYLDAVEEQFQEAYIEKCLNVYEDFFMEYEDTEHHFTLYYYDQAGNLVRTIPPNGVKKVTDIDLSDPLDGPGRVAADMAQIKADRANNTHTYFTKHTMPTTYKYNSLNELVAQATPDNESLEIWKPTTANTGIPSTYDVTSTAFSDGLNGQAFTVDPSGVGHIYVTTNGGASWSEMTSIGIDDLNDVQFTDPSTALIAYTVGQDGRVLKTTDGGATWIISTPPTTDDLYRIHFINNTSGRAFGKDGKQWKTTDGGATWTYLGNPMTGMLGSALITDISFNDDYNGFAVIDDGTIYGTSDEGDTWVGLTSIKTVGMNDATIISGVRYNVGKDGTLLTSTDNGATWQEVTNNLTAELKYVHFGSSTTGWVLDVNGIISSTTSSGTSWSNLPGSLGSTVFTDLFFDASGNAYAIKADGKYAIYNSSTTTWGSLSSTGVGTGTDVNSVFTIAPFNSTGVGYMGADAGIIYSTADGGTTWTNSGGAVISTSEDIVEMQLDASFAGTLLTASGKMYASSGSSFSAVSATSSHVYSDMHFASASNGFAISEDGYLATTTDGGQTWTQTGSAVFSSLGTDKLKAIYLEGTGGSDKGTVTGENGRLYITTNGGSTWINKTSSAELPPLYGVHNLDANRTYACGLDGTIVRSLDAGSTWQVLESNTSSDLYDINFYSSTIGAAVGKAGAAVYTSTGSSWTVSTTTETEDLRSILFTSSSDAYAVGDGCSGIKTTSGGASWGSDMISSSSTDELLALSQKAGNLLAVGEDGKILKYNGSFWTSLNTLIAPVMNDAELVGLDGFAVGINGSILATTNGGTTWITQVSGTLQNLNAVYVFPDGDEAYVVGDNATVLHTTNGGTTWTAVSTPFSSGTKLNDVNFSDVFGIIVGDNGEAANTTTSVTTWVACTTGTSVNLNAVTVVDNTFAYVVGELSTIIKVTNDATVWTNKEHTPSPQNWVAYLTGTGPQDLMDVYFKDYVTGYAIGKNGTMIKTYTGGETWVLENLNEPSSPPTNDLTDITVIDNNNFFISGSAGYVEHVTDMKDEFASQFWYDRLGRMVVSQNSKQYNKTTDHLTYSYTVYDPLGRIEEVGEIAAQPGSGMGQGPIESQFSGLQLNDGLYNAWLGLGTRTQVTTTLYDDAATTAGSFVQKNLRKRVSASYFDEDGIPGNGYDYATYYSYDIHGNVNHLLQDNPSLASLTPSQQYKTIDYEYDLISGNVKKVSFQAGARDAFYHKYEYDSDNRITNAYSSKDAVIWDKDAKYFYYDHGPMSRVEVGDQKVQGIDYAYTLQGWIKGVNSTNLDTENDMGKDAGLPAASNLNRNLAKDVFSYGLNYYNNDAVSGFNGDYKSISGSDNFIASVTGATYLPTQAPNLFNGNISSMTTTLVDNSTSARTPLPQLTAYRYDQLNRIKQMKAYRDIASNAWGNGSGYDQSYESTYGYDANGNLLAMKTNGVASASLPMDDFTYNYENIANGYTRNTNRLRSVDDAVSASAYDGTDVDDQLDNNYEYDEIGNLVHDTKEGIDEIQWTVYGKIKSITRMAGYSVTIGSTTTYPSNLEFKYDPSGNRIAKIEKPRDASGEKASTEWITTYYVRDATGNVMSTYVKRKTVATSAVDLYVGEAMIYGSSRVGVYNYNDDVNLTVAASGDPAIFDRKLGRKQYELSNHLGNVLTTVSDRKMVLDNYQYSASAGGDYTYNSTLDEYTYTPGTGTHNRSSGTDNKIDGYFADLISAQDYYPFGAPMPGRGFSSSTGYRFGFNGKENDAESTLSGNGLQDYGMRIYNPSIGKFLSVDPITWKYPELTPFQFASNRPIDGIDQDGLEHIKANEQVAPPSAEYPNGRTFQEAFGDLYADKIETFEDETYYDVGRLFYRNQDGYISLDNYNKSDELIVKFKFDEPEWITKATGEYGVEEALEDGTDNPRVQEYHDINREYKPQGTQEGNPWCASFVGWCLSGTACNAQLDPSAQSYSNVNTRYRKQNDIYADPVWGQSISDPSFGAIGVRKNKGGQWHVGFVVGASADGKDIFLLGGNQDDQVNITRLPRSEFKAFVYPSNYQAPASFSTLPTYNSKVPASKGGTR